MESNAILISNNRNIGKFSYYTRVFYRKIDQSIINPLTNKELKIYKRYKNSAKARNIKFNLSKHYFKRLINSRCEYCRCKYDEFNGIDRMQSDLDYTPNNCVTCCQMCNRAKLTMSPCDFLDRMYEIRGFKTTKDIVNEINQYETVDNVIVSLNKLCDGNIRYINKVIDILLRSSKIVTEFDTVKINNILLTRNDFLQFYCNFYISDISDQKHKILELSVEHENKKDDIVIFNRTLIKQYLLTHTNISLLILQKCKL